MVEGGAAKVNEPHRGVTYPPLAALLDEEKTTRLVQPCFRLKSIGSKWGSSIALLEV